jgi:phosphomevalonate kinase
MISSLVTTLLLHLGILPRDQILNEGILVSNSLALAHNTAQYAHCLAQGKFGSGFDVAAAIYGSHVYTRFDPKVLDPLMSKTLVGILLNLVFDVRFNRILSSRPQRMLKSWMFSRL